MSVRGVLILRTVVSVMTKAGSLPSQEDGGHWMLDNENEIKITVLVAAIS